MARAAVARSLARRLDRMSADERAALQLVIVDELLVVLGPEPSLPWVDGVRYLGADPDCASLLLPTTLETTVSALLVERALRRATTLSAGPIALLTMTEVVPLGRALPVTRATLAPLLEEPA